MSIEEFFQALDHQLRNLTTSAESTVKHTRAAEKGARSGALAAARRSLEASRDAVQGIHSQIEAAEQAMQAVEEGLARDAGSVQREVARLAHQNGVPWLPTEGSNAFVSFPVLVKFGGDSVRIDRKLLRSQRPSAIFEAIQKARAGRTDAPAKVLELVFRAAKVAAGYAGIDDKRLPPTFKASAAAVYEVLSLNAPDYTKEEFTRHLYLLDRNRATELTKSPRYRLTFSASTGTRGNRSFGITDETGHRHDYYVLQFERIG